MTIQELLALLLSGDLSSVTDDELSVHETTLQDEFDARRAAGVRGADALSELAQIVEAVDAVRAEAANRIQIAEDEATQVAEMEARLRPVEPEPEVEEAVASDPEPEPEAEPEPEPEPEAVVEAVPVAASAAPVTTRPRTASLASLRSDPAPRNDPPSQLRLVATPNVPATRRSIAEAFMEMDRQVGYAPFSMNHVVLNVRGDYPESRRLLLRNPEHNERILSALIGPEPMLAGAMTASALCGPATPYYSLAQISQAARPFHDGLASLSVSERGKMTFNRPFALSDFSGAVGIWTDADNEDEDAEKNCATIDCADSVTAEVKAFTRCLTINNFFARYNPEMVAQAVDFTLVNWARLSEVDLIDSVKAASVQTVAGRSIGALADWAYTLRVAAASYRNSDRMLADANLVASFPAWIVDALGGDLARAQHNYAEQLLFTRAEMERIAAAMNVRLFFYIDSPSTGTSQNFTQQGVGNLRDYPEFVQWGLWHEGAHVVLDGGPDLNFGITRDAVSNRQNVYQTFGESIEGYAFLGVKSLWVTQAICPSGTFSAPVDIQDDVCTGSGVPGS